MNKEITGEIMPSDILLSYFEGERENKNMGIILKLGDNARSSMYKFSINQWVVYKSDVGYGIIIDGIHYVVISIKDILYIYPMSEPSPETKE